MFVTLKHRNSVHGEIRYEIWVGFFSFFQVKVKVGWRRAGRQWSEGPIMKFPQKSFTNTAAVHCSAFKTECLRHCKVAESANVSAVQLSPWTLHCPNVCNTQNLCSATLQSFVSTLNFPELKTGDKLYFRGGPDAENENWKSLKTSQSLIERGWLVLPLVCYCIIEKKL